MIAIDPDATSLVANEIIYTVIAELGQAIASAQQSANSMIDAGNEGDYMLAFDDDYRALVNDLGFAAQEARRIANALQQTAANFFDTDIAAMNYFNPSYCLILPITDTNGNIIGVVPVNPVTGMPVGTSPDNSGKDDGQGVDFQPYSLQHGTQDQWYLGYRQGNMNWNDITDFLRDDPLTTQPIDYLSADAVLFREEWNDAGGLLYYAEGEHGHLGLLSGDYTVGYDGSIDLVRLLQGDGDLTVRVYGEAGVYLIDGEYTTTLAGIDMAARGYVGATAAGDLGLSVNPWDGDLYVGANGEVFVGGKLEGEVGTQIWAVDVGANGAVLYGLGAGGTANIGLQDGVFAFDLEGSLAVGLGLEGGVSFELDVQQAATDIGNAAWGLAEDVGIDDELESVGDTINDGLDTAGDTFNDGVDTVRGIFGI